MMLQIDPGIPLVWRSPTSMQLGVDEPIAVLADVSLGEERLVAALRRGISRAGYDMTARAAGVSAAVAERILFVLTPALRSSPRRPPRRAAVLGTGPLATELAAILDDEGRLDPDPTATEVVVLVADWIIAPADHTAWLSRDVPHLPVVTGDRGVTVGPLVDPGVGPCLFCVHLARRDDDPAWPAIASQLWGRPAPALPRTTVARAAAFAARRLTTRPGRRGEAVSWRIEATSGRITPIVRRRHPECLCAAPPESDWALVPGPALPGETTTARAVSGPW